MQLSDIVFFCQSGIMILWLRDRPKPQKRNLKKFKKSLYKHKKICYTIKEVKRRKELIKMDKRISYKLVIDTETCPIDKSMKDVFPQNMWTYDVGWAVVDKRGNVYKTRSFVNAEIFCEEKELMQSAYYSKKIPMYWEDIKQGKRVLTNFYNIRKALLEDLQEYNIKEVYAHNMRFDYSTLTTTQKWLTKSKYRKFFPKDVIICDTLKMARDVIGKMPTYVSFCEKNGYVTKNNKPQFKAEILYRFISKDNNFIESHTGLEDVMIEKDILAYCYKQHKKMRKKLWEN